MFTIASMDCVSCSPGFKRALGHIDGVTKVSDLPLLNKIVVDYDTKEADEQKVIESILGVAKRAGLDGKIVFSKR